LAALTTAAALVVLAADRRRGRAAVLVAALGIAAVVAAARALPDPLAAVLGRRYPGERVLWRHEGVQSTVSVHQRADGTRVMYLDGLHQANDSAPMRIVHRLIGTLPMALHPDPRRALVIGLGGGTTAGAVATFPGAVVDIVELSDGVVRAADWFRHINGDVLRQPNVRLHVDDGRNYLLRTPGRYDVITADIIQPFHAGAGNLYSVEYFRLGRAALDEDGVMLQWIGHRPRSQYQLIARTFLSVFPDATVWAGGTLLAGTRAPLRLSLARLRQRIADPAVGAAFGRAGIVGASGLVGLFTAGPDELRRFIGPGPVLTDDRPLVEYFLSLPRGEPDIDLRGLRGDVTRYLAP
ncbi:MAG TPA: hypothetical protein VNI83_03465, partial [Vicinamibacterales bacterium]|nr:hypothetical protein [Vicinamibacterales bacterium]